MGRLVIGEGKEGKARPGKMLVNIQDQTVLVCQTSLTIGSEKLRTLFTAPGNFFLKLKKVMRYAQSPNRVSKRAMSGGGIRRHLGNLETWWSTVVQVIREMEDVKKADRAVQQSQQE